MNSSEVKSPPLTAIPNGRDVFYISSLVRITLLTFYLALMTPLPFLAQVTAAAVPASTLAIGIAIGGCVLYGVLSEQVITTETGIQVTYPAWVKLFLRRGWRLDWNQIKALKPRSTGQGGLVYYFVSQAEEAYLLPMRIAGFARLVRQVEAKTAIDTR
ncbi:MAG: hypothetical protein HC873_22390, partial [Leptolyngbyaceae cyanobacterium SL_1_1]|nr:hypothetical protein [Leptolyngbyaceae cyanobacterium SL_1_1]